MTGEPLFPIVIDEAGKPLAKAVGGTLADAWQGIIGDRVTAWRIRNAAKISEALGKQLAEKGQALNLDKIPEGVAFAWFEKATQSDEPEIQALFAKLLANAAAGNADAIKKRNIDLVASLTPDDARLLEIIAGWRRSFLTSPKARFQDFNIKLDWGFNKALEQAQFEDQGSIDALLSLGILRFQRDYSIDDSRMKNTIRKSRRLGGEWDFVPAARDALICREWLDVTAVGQSLIAALFPQEDLPGE